MFRGNNWFRGVVESVRFQFAGSVRVVLATITDTEGEIVPKLQADKSGWRAQS